MNVDVTLVTDAFLCELHFIIYFAFSWNCDVYCSTLNPFIVINLHQFNASLFFAVGLCKPHVHTHTTILRLFGFCPGQPG